ncbi:restriction endonuclease subunit S, partial [Cardiobacterium sp. AH-315-I02]|nr:restriction endonuclease subunit S [Cardiobacterium sp. AH-315-I02]
PYLVKENEVFYFKDGNLTWFRKYKNLEPLFLYYFFLSSVGKERLNEITIGSTQSALTIAGLKTIQINLPPLTEQKTIAKILSSFDEKIELLREENKTLETIAQTFFKEWFVNFNYPGATGEMVDSELGEIPKGWRSGKLVDVTSIKGGTTPSTKNSNYWGGRCSLD